MNIETATAEQILTIPLDEPERLFSREKHHEEFLQMAKKWHPDRNSDPGAGAVFAHITNLRNRAAAKARDNKWTEPNTLILHETSGRTIKFHYKRKHPFELGEMFIGQKVVVFRVPRGNRTNSMLVANGVKHMAGVRYPDNRMRAATEILMPHVLRQFTKPEHRTIIIDKSEGTILLRDLLTHCGGKLEAKHTAWIISSLLSTIAFFELSKLTHNGLSPETVFINPKLHTAHVLGGWWYAAEKGTKLTHLPPFSHPLASPTLRAKKVADQRLDLECVKEIGRICLGSEDAPKQMSRFLKLPSGSSGIAEYEAWGKVLVNIWGEKRRFTQLSVKESDVYP